MLPHSPHVLATMPRYSSVLGAEHLANESRDVLRRGWVEIRHHDDVVAAGQVALERGVEPLRPAGDPEAREGTVGNAPRAKRRDVAEQVLRGGVATACRAAAPGKQLGVARDRRVARWVRT